MALEIRFKCVNTPLTHLVSDVAVVVHHCPHPADALLAAAAPQQSVALSVGAAQEHAQYAGAGAVHVVVKDQALRGRRAPQVRGQQSGLVTWTHEGRLDVHEVAWGRKVKDTVIYAA